MKAAIHDLGTPDRILAAALSREKEAYQFYSDVLAQCTPDVVRDLVERLRDEESKHVRMIESMISNLNLGRDAI